MNLPYFFSIWILFTNRTCFWALKGEKTSCKTAFVSCIESDSCIIAFLKVLSKTSKGRYLDFKRASFASQKGVNWKPIYALFVCGIRIFFTIAHILTGTIEDLKDRSMRKSIVLLLLCLSFLQLTSNSLTRLLVTLSTKEMFFCYSVFHLSCLQVTCYLVYSLPCQQKKRFSVTLSLYSALLLFLCYFVFILSCLNLTFSQISLVILSIVIVVIIIMNYELWILN